MTIPEIKKLLLAEIENKKSYDATFSTRCTIGGETIEQGESFIFMGDKQKVCNNCQADIQSFLEET